jgi:hypothetical protein
MMMGYLRLISRNGNEFQLIRKNYRRKLHQVLKNNVWCIYPLICLLTRTHPTLTLSPEYKSYSNETCFQIWRLNTDNHSKGQGQNTTFQGMSHLKCVRTQITITFPCVQLVIFQRLEHFLSNIWRKIWASEMNFVQDARPETSAAANWYNCRIISKWSLDDVTLEFHTHVFLLSVVSSNY